MIARLTICIPISPEHQEISNRAITSAQVQTDPCEIITYLDKDRKGPGFARNRMFEKVQTPFVTFLDADDQLTPLFAQTMIAKYKDRYLYCDWFDDEGTLHTAPECPWVDGTWHPVTTFLPVKFFKAAGGFNENLKGLEDTDFYMKLCTSKMCGQRVDQPLFVYSKYGTRSKKARSTGLEKELKSKFVVMYGGLKMACCGNPEQQVVTPPNGRFEGAVVAETLWGGNHTEMGLVTRRIYPRSGNGRLMWVDPRDIEASPRLWRKVEQPPEPELPAPEVEIKPDIKSVLRMYNRIASSSEEPVFYLPKIANSYADLKTLVLLSGFKIVEEVSPFDTAPVIVSTPYEGVYEQLNDMPRRIIAWQLEYAGSYGNNLGNFNGEIWASDAAWAKRHNAKYVLMGSDSKLGSYMDIPYEDKKFDVSMLGYMVPRRQDIKDSLKQLSWPEDYPGNGEQRDNILRSTKLMLHVHQHENNPYCAPQRFAVAAAFNMPILSENIGDPGLLEGYYNSAPYPLLTEGVLGVLERKFTGEKLHKYLCEDNNFRKCVLEALK